MANREFAFLFYPGEYLRDTQCLSEPAQVAYDRILCEHMRNISITQQKLNFFTKRLSPDDIDTLKSVLSEENGTFSITWVVESINKRKGFVESRRNNRQGKTKDDMKNISKTYDEHKVIVNEIVIEKENKKVVVTETAKGAKNEKLILPYDDHEFKQAWETLLTQKKWKGKSKVALQASLKKLAGRDVSEAIQMIENTIAGEWQGIFELKPSDRGSPKKPDQVDKYRAASAKQDEEIIKMHGSK